MKLLLALLLVFQAHANLEKFFKTFERTPQQKVFRNIDYIYLINLDQRPEKHATCMWQLAPYGIAPHRFSAVNGWDLSTEELNEIGVKFQPGMIPHQWAIYFPEEKDFDIDFLREECYGKTFFSRWITRGAIGCTLSHLSVLKNAYEAGLETIWILEDDLFVIENPYYLDLLIDRLDLAVGKENWDVLYTDFDVPDKPMYDWSNDFLTDLKGKLWWFRKPDAPSWDFSLLAKRTPISTDFIKIGSRMRTHSMIVRRSGMKKILDYMNEHHIFIPYDHDLAFVPDLQMFSLLYPIVSFSLGVSDVKNKNF